MGSFRGRSWEGLRQGEQGGRRLAPGHEVHVEVEPARDAQSPFDGSVDPRVIVAERRIIALDPLCLALADFFQPPPQFSQWREPDHDLPSGLDVAESVALRAVLMSALAELPPRQRACVVLRYFDDLSVADTAAVLGCSEGTVKSQTSRALTSLRSTFEGSPVGGLATRGATPW